MQTNHSFSMQRFILLCRQSLIINKKLIAISLAGFTGTLFIALILFQSAADFRNWENADYMRTFAVLFFSLGIIYASLSFPAFRSKEKSMAFLMLPTSASEKYLYELLSRVVLIILIIPFLFWIVANLEGAVVNHYVPELTNYKFSFGETWSDINNVPSFNGWAKFAMLQGCLFVFIAAFTGASHFIKSPLLKTMFTLSVVVAGGALFTLFLVKGLNIREFHPVNHRILFIRNEQEAMTAFSIGITVINLCLLAIAWFSLKEKEV